MASCYIVISPQSEYARYFFTLSGGSPNPKRYIILVIAASLVMSCPLTTPAWARVLPVS